MIHLAVAAVRHLDHESICVIVGLGCYALIPFAWANEKANGLISAIRSLKP